MRVDVQPDLLVWARKPHASDGLVASVTLTWVAVNVVAQGVPCGHE